MESGHITDDVEIIFQPGEWGIVTGCITERVSGEPLEGMRVHVEPDDGMWFERRAGWVDTQGKTDADGLCFIDDCRLC